MFAHASLHLTSAAGLQTIAERHAHIIVIGKTRACVPTEIDDFIATVTMLQ